MAYSLRSTISSRLAERSLSSSTLSTGSKHDKVSRPGKKIGKSLVTTRIVKTEIEDVDVSTRYDML